MKSKKEELDVDFIGGNEPLNAAERKALNDYFKNKKSRLHTARPSSGIRVKKDTSLSK